MLVEWIKMPIGFTMWKIAEISWRNDHMIVCKKDYVSDKCLDTDFNEDEIFLNI